MTKFEEQLRLYLPRFQSALATDSGDWVVKGFIDLHKNIYTISIDTKVISKIIELMLFPLISEFAIQNSYQMVLSEHQNHYPDVTFIDDNNNKIALDFKSTYRKNSKTVSGLTLGAFTGYFRQRSTAKNITFPYDQYSQHFVLVVIYTRHPNLIDERQVYQIEDLPNIQSVAHDFTFLLQEKWKLAIDRPGSGNTKNIGSVTIIDDLINGNGIFANYGEKVFDDYWMNYLTSDMARAIDSVVPYSNLGQYFQWKNR